MQASDELGCVVGFDLDGVIIDHTQNKIRFAARYGVVLTSEQTHSEVMGSYFPPELYREIKGQLYESSPEALEAPLMEGAFNTLAAVREAGIPYFLVSLQKNPMHATHLLEERGLWGTCFTPENTFFAGNAEGKHHHAKALGVTHFFDDEPNILQIMESVPHRVLYDPRGLFLEPKPYVRVSRWDEIADILGVALR